MHRPSRKCRLGLDVSAKPPAAARIGDRYLLRDGGGYRPMILAVDLLPNGLWAGYPYLMAGALTRRLREAGRNSEQTTQCRSIIDHLVHIVGFQGRYCMVVRVACDGLPLVAAE